MYIKRHTFKSLYNYVCRISYFIFSVEFSSDSKQTFSAVIDPLYIEFSHLLMKMPWKSCDIQNLKFSTVWDWVLNRKTGDK